MRLGSAEIREVFKSSKVGAIAGVIIRDGLITRKSKARILRDGRMITENLSIASLRRVLLSSVQGTAVTAIQIDGVLHEFSSIDGVREDVTDIVLNVKALALDLKTSGPKKLILDAKGPGEIKAKMIAQK